MFLIGYTNKYGVCMGGVTCTIRTLVSLSATILYRENNQHEAHLTATELEHTVKVLMVVYFALDIPSRDRK
jgi:hypothetical protein